MFREVSYGHKMIGSPLPCSVVLARRKYVDHLQKVREVEYVRCMEHHYCIITLGARPPHFVSCAMKAMVRDGAESGGICGLGDEAQWNSNMENAQFADCGVSKDIAVDRGEVVPCGDR